MTVPAWTEMQLAVGGALRLARGDRSGLGCFDASLDGFWRSFRAAAICYPLYLLLLSLRIGAAQWDEGGVATILIVETIAYVISWVAFPLMILPLTGWLGREHRFLAFMVAYNWSQIPQTVLLVLVASERAAGFLPAAGGQVAELAAVGAILVYEWYIARVALAVNVLRASAVVAVDVVLGVTLTDIARALY
jgi:hypothetical protein